MTTPLTRLLLYPISSSVLESQVQDVGNPASAGGLMAAPVKAVKWGGLARMESSGRGG